MFIDEPVILNIESNDMEEIKISVLKEYKDLKQKIDRLKKFTHDENNKSVVGKTQWSLLHFQFQAMMNYLVILDDRLKNFGIKY